MDKLALLIPVFLLLAWGEWWLTRKTRPGQFSLENTFLNMCIGAIDRILSLASFALFVWILSLTYDHFRIWTPEATWDHWVLAFIAADFVSYWYHRFSHRIAFLWCGHVTHHSSDHFNLSNGFRTSPFQGLYRIPFWIVLPVLGFSPTVLVVTFIISGLYDFFLHTQNFPKYRWLELVLITPSLHKVHHGKNDEYIDKNYGSTFVIWDRLFGTFQDEKAPVRYGILSKSYRDGDPVDAIFHHYKYLWMMMRATPSWKDRLKLLVMPPDWRPANVVCEDAPPELSPVPDRRSQYYAVSLFGGASIGVFLILVFRETCTLYGFGVYAVFLLTGMIASTRLFNRRQSVQYRRHEIARNLFFAGAFAAMYYWTEGHPLHFLAACGATLLFCGWAYLLPRPMEAAADAYLDEVVRRPVPKRASAHAVTIRDSAAESGADTV